MDTMLDIFTGVVNAIRNLLFGEGKRSEIVANGAILLIGILFLTVALESAMGLITIGRLERQINLLKELSSLSESGLGSNSTAEILDDLHSTYVDALNNYNPTDVAMWIRVIYEQNRETVQSILPGAFPWLLISLVVPFAMDDGRLMKAGVFIIVIFIGAIVGLVTASIFAFADQNINGILRFLAGCGSIGALLLIANLKSGSNDDDSSSDEGSAGA